MEITSKILFKEWKLKKNAKELTIMKISITGINKDGNTEKIIYSLYDEFNETTNTSSMARTTGYTATATVNLIIENLFNEKGVFPPEFVGKHKDCFDFVVNYLEDRDVIYKKQKLVKNG